MEISPKLKNKFIDFIKGISGFLLVYIVVSLLYSYLGERDQKLEDYDLLFSDILFGYDYENKNHMNKHHLSRNSVLVDKTIFQIKDYEKVSKKLQAKGWRLVEFKNDSYIYCLNPYNEFTIINPQKRKYIGKYGGNIKFSEKDLENWHFILQSNSDGTESCANYNKAN